MQVTNDIHVCTTYFTHTSQIKPSFFVVGNKSKCRGLLRKGKDVGAQPKELLIKAYDNFVAGRKVLIDDCEELTGFAYRVQQKSSESSVDLSPLSTGKGTCTCTYIYT